MTTRFYYREFDRSHFSRPLEMKTQVKWVENREKGEEAEAVGSGNSFS